MAAHVALPNLPVLLSFEEDSVDAVTEAFSSRAAKGRILDLDLGPDRKLIVNLGQVQFVSITENEPALNEGQTKLELRLEDMK